VDGVLKLYLKIVKFLKITGKRAGKLANITVGVSK
jgi:hypothetical protein